MLLTRLVVVEIQTNREVDEGRARQLYEVEVCEPAAHEVELAVESFGLVGEDQKSESTGYT